MTGTSPKLAIQLSRLRRDPRSAPAVLGLAMICSAVAVLYLGRGVTFSGDEAIWVASTPGLDLHTVFQPHGGHLLATTRLVYWPILEMFGIGYLPFRILALLATLLSVGLLFIWARRRVDDWVALAPCLVLLFFGADYMHLFQGNGFTVMMSLALGLAALLAFERSDRKGDLLACLFLSLGVLTYTVILPFVAGLAVALLRDRDLARRGWVILVPLLIYVDWRIWLLVADVSSSGGGIEPENLLVIPAWVFQSVSGVLSALSGFDFDFSGEGAAVDPLAGAGPPLAVGALGLLAWVVVRRGATRGLLVAGAIALSLWSLQALAAPEASGIRVPGGDSRYMYPGAFVLLMVAFEAARRWRPARRALVLLLVAALAGAGTNLMVMRDNAAFLRHSGEQLRAYTGAVALVAEARPEEVSVELSNRMIGENPVSGMLGMVRQDYGRFGYTPEELRALSPQLRQLVDGLFVPASALSFEPLPAGDPVSCAVVPGGVVEASGRVILRSPGGGEVTAGRFADAPTVPVGELAPGRPAAVELPDDSAPAPWQFASSGPLEVCR